MKIYTKAGDLAFKTFKFPDGQPHFKLETYELEFRSVTIETAIKNADDLFLVLLASDVLRNHGYSEVNLDIRYLMGARMDRAIDTQQPFTLQAVARLLNGAGFNTIRILDVHSDVALRLIRNSRNVRPYAAFDSVLTTLGPNVRPVRPDVGAENRTSCYVQGKYYVRCEKKRDPQTGYLSKFVVTDANMVAGHDCLIVDDICDGGATFVGLAEELKSVGALKIYLYITHGIFSKGIYLEGISRVFCTDSYDGEEVRAGSDQGTIYNNGVPTPYEPFTVIPVSMKDL